MTFKKDVKIALYNICVAFAVCAIIGTGVITLSLALIYLFE